MKLFIAQPMTGKSDDEINLIRGIVSRAYIDHLIETKEFTTVELIDQVNLPDPVSIPVGISDHEIRLRYLGRSIQLLATADIVIFAGDWQNAKGCNIEMEICKRYNIPTYNIKEYMKDHRYVGDRYELVFPELGEYEDTETSLSTDIPYPLCIIYDRHNGKYSGGRWIAFNCTHDDIPLNINADVAAIACAEAWASLRMRRNEGKILYGVGNTPEDAINDLESFLE